MLERDRIALRKARAEIAAQERAEKEEQERPVREATEKLNELHRKLYNVTRERILNMSDMDEDGVSAFWIDPALAGVSMDRSFGGAFDADEYLIFLRAHSSWFYDCEANRRQLFGYCERNGAQIFNSEMLRRAALRLQEYGLLEERPAPPPQPEKPYVNLTLDRPPAPVTYTGWDEQTGLEREFTEKEVSRMSSDTYRRIFRVLKGDMILPNAGPGPMGFRG
jgi:hypothetical protein